MTTSILPRACEHRSQGTLGAFTDWNTLPQPILRTIHIFAGAVAAARAAIATADSFGLPVRSEDFWVTLSQHLWPAATLPPQTCCYETARSLVADGNRGGAWRAWRPQQSAWTWKANGAHRFYCGRATLLALDERDEMLHVFVHAVCSYPDLRYAATSCMFEATQLNWESFVANDQATRLHVSRKLASPKSTSFHQSAREDRASLRWPASEFRAGFVYVFAYASQYPHSDYRMVRLLDLTDLPGHFPGHSAGTSALRAAAGSAGGAFFVAPSHAEGEDLRGRPLHDVAKALLDDAAALPPGLSFA